MCPGLKNSSRGQVQFPSVMSTQGSKKFHLALFRFQVLTRDTEFVHLNKAETFLSFSSLRQRLLHVRAHLLEMILEFLILLPSFLQC